MKKYSFLVTALALVLLMAALHFVALTFYFYWVLWWFDVIMHFLGGLSLGFIALYIFYESSYFVGKVPVSKVVLVSFLFVLVVGVGWEIFEYLNGLTDSTEKYSLDIIHDLIADSLGAILAALIAKPFLKSV